MTSKFRVVEHTLPAAHIREFPRATADSQEAVLHLAVKQYIPIDNPHPQPGDVTIIGAHANGFPKELYEPLWDEIHARQAQHGFRIRNIWIADVAQQGYSGVMNEDALGNDPSWWDHSRDLLHLINTMREHMPLPLVGVGHSMGAAHLVNLSLMHPRLLTSLVLLDPVIQPEVSLELHPMNPARLSTFRRDVWPSRAAAAASFKKSPYYQKWDPRVLERWVQHGLRDLPTPVHPDAAVAIGQIATPDAAATAVAPPAVTLRTTKHQEVFTFLRPTYPPTSDVDNSPSKIHNPDLAFPVPSSLNAFYRPEPPATYAKLPYLRPATLYVLGGDSNISTKGRRDERTEITGTGPGGSGGVEAGQVKEITLVGIGHLVPMEDVFSSADLGAEWIGKGIAGWRETEKATWEWWKGKELAEKRVIGERWKREMGGGLPAKKKKDAKL